MENNLFRKSTMDRISSPDQLNDYIKVTSVSVWCILAGLFVFVLGVGIWGFTGSIPETVQVEGVAYAVTDNANAVYCFLPLGTAKRLKEGMNVQVSPEYAPRSEYGFIYGKIAKIGKRPVTEQQIVKTFGSLKYLQGLLPEGNALEIKLSLEEVDNKLQWSNKKGETITLSSGSKCSVLIITKARKPYQLVLN